MAAWRRDEQDPQPASESPDQRAVRSHAATLALIGLTVEERGVAGPDGMSVELHPDLVHAAVAAAGSPPSGSRSR